jgi:F0F1-type ATP synthase epsilon subunit
VTRMGDMIAVGKRGIVFVQQTEVTIYCRQLRQCDNFVELEKVVTQKQKERERRASLHGAMREREREKAASARI